MLSAEREQLLLLVVSADPLARASLSRELAAQLGIQVLGRSAPGSEVSASLRTRSVDALLVDGGAQELEEDGLPENPPPWVCLVPSAEAAAQALRLGAAGVLRREAEPAHIAAALWSVTRSLVVVEPAFLSALLPEAATARANESLTTREREVLEQLARGLSNKQIAGTLGISDHTVKFHVNSLLGKLGAQSRTEVVVRATRRGWLSL